MEIARNLEHLTTARQAGLVGCRRCLLAWPMGTPRCGRCGSRLVSRDRGSLQRVWAWWVAGVLFYIPANLYPMLETRTLFTRNDATIIEGAVELAQYGAFGVAAIILLASVAIPLAKFGAVALLALGIQRGSDIPPRRRHLLYEIVEYIGRWSMIDVFVVAILSSLVQLNIAASIKPGPASLAFALSVIFTMLSAQSFDPRMFWDRMDADTDRKDPPA
ncbi:MAG: paraquat-inducible protein A [Tranquillimonas sp.]|jgi:paraquat-inducible protein A